MTLSEQRFELFAVAFGIAKLKSLIIARSLQVGIAWTN